LPNSLPVIGKDGLFPGGAKGKSLSDQAVAEGFLRVEEEKVKVGARTKKILKGILLEKGIEKVLAIDSPKAALEALVPAVQSLGSRAATPDIEAFRQELGRATKTCLDAVASVFSKLETDVMKTIQPATAQPAVSPAMLSAALHQALERVKPPAAITAPAVRPPEMAADLGPEIVAFVNGWAGEKSVGCTFDVLWDDLKKHHPQISIGAFQDALRKLHDANQIRLGGWARMVDDIPQPQLALFVSSKVMYHAQPANTSI
jgi:hypothetical protein